MKMTIAGHWVSDVWCKLIGWQVVSVAQGCRQISDRANDLDTYD